MGGSLYDQLLAEGLAPRSAREYSNAIWRAQQWFAEHGLDLKRASPSSVVAYADSLPRTHSSRKLARASLRWYWQLQKRRNPPVRAIRVPRRRKMVCRALDEPDAHTLELAARSRADDKGLAVLVCLYLALRREEVAELRWDGFNEGWLTLVGKGDAERTIPVNPILAERLVSKRLGQPRQLRRGLDGSPWVFPGRCGGHISPATVWAWVREVARDAGLEEVPTHRLRHTALATANDHLGDLRAVQEFAGHARPETTAGYTRATGARLQAVSAALLY